jgi:hypothetical protein
VASETVTAMTPGSVLGSVSTLEVQYEHTKTGELTGSTTRKKRKETDVQGKGYCLQFAK